MNQPQPFTLPGHDPIITDRVEALQMIEMIAHHFKIPITSPLSDEVYIREIVYSMGNREGYNLLGGSYKTPELIPTLEGLWDRWTLHPSAKDYINKNSRDHVGFDNPIGQFVFDDESDALRFRAVLTVSNPSHGEEVYPHIFETESIFALEAWLTFYLNFANRYAGTPTVYLTIATAEFFERNPFTYDSL